MKTTAGKHTHENAFSLMELLLYMGILSIITGALVGILTDVTTTQVKEAATGEISSQLGFTMETIQRLVRTSSVVDIPAGTATSSLTLRMESPSVDPTLIFLQNNTVYVQQGTSTPQSLTNANVTVNSLEFKKLTQYPGKDIVQIDLAMSTTNTVAGSTISRSLRSAISRASAAVFDDNLIPGTDNSYSLGNVSSRWQGGSFAGDVTIAGNLGIGLTNPSYDLDVTGTMRVSTTTTFSAMVGIGTASPQELLSITKDSAATSTALTLMGLNRTTSGTASDGIGSTLTFRAEASDGSLVDTGHITAALETASSTSPRSSLLLSARSSGIYIADDGNVGVGTLTPDVKLDVYGNLQVGSGSGYIYTFDSTVSDYQTPRCACDKTTDLKDCATEFDSASDQGATCYDQWLYMPPLGAIQQKSEKFLRTSAASLAIYTTGGKLGIATSTPTDTLTVFGTSALGGHLISYGTTPSVGECGSFVGPTIRGTDTAGIVTTGGGPVTSCTITFATPYNEIPACILTNNTSTSTTLSLTPTTEYITIISSVSMGVSNISYFCMEIPH